MVRWRRWSDLDAARVDSVSSAAVKPAIFSGDEEGHRLASLGWVGGTADGLWLGCPSWVCSWEKIAQSEAVSFDWLLI